MAWVFDSAPTTRATDQLVLLAIADRCDDDGREAYPSTDTIARKTRLTRRTVIDALKRLEHEVGVLTVRRGAGKRGTHRYEVRTDATCEARSPGKELHMGRGFTPTREAPSQGVRSSFTARCESPSPAPSNTSSTSGTSKEESPRAEDLQASWNAVTDSPIPRCTEMNPQRRRQADARLRDRGLAGMREVFTRINALPFCRGENDRGWRANFDWALKPESIAKVLEGNYVNDGHSHRSTSGSRTAGNVTALQRFAARGQAS